MPRYNHQFAVGFSVSTNATAEHCTPEELLRALWARLDELERMPGPEALEAFACTEEDQE